MKTKYFLYYFLFVLLFNSTSVFGSDIDISIPTSFKDSAEKAFQEGLDYFLWTDEEIPVKCPGNQYDPFRLLQISVYYYTQNDQAVSFKTAIEIIYEDTATDKVKKNTVFAKSDNEGSIKPAGRYTAIYVVTGMQLSGKGKAVVYFVKDIDNPSEEDRISNQLMVDVVF